MKLTAWSPSRLKTYETCPLQARYKFIDKLPEPPAEALERGLAVHKEAEEFISGKRAEFPASLEKVRMLAEPLRELYKANKVSVERQVAFTKDWRLTEWFSKDTWVRFQLDVVEHLDTGAVRIIDWKTGKVRSGGSEYRDQLELYGLAAIAAGWSDRAWGMLAFVDSGQTISMPECTVTQGNFKDMAKKWEERAAWMLNDEQFAPRPGFYCRWCHFRASNQGPCDHG